MKDFTPAVELTEKEAHHIGAAMRRISAADGIHEEEQRIIDEFLSGVPGQVPAEVDFSLFQAEPLRRVFLWSVALVALADGGISAEEKATLHDFAQRVGAGDAEVAAALRDVGCFLLSTFAGVRLYRDEAVRIGQGLGLSPEDIAQVLDG